MNIINFFAFLPLFLCEAGISRNKVSCIFCLLGTEQFAFLASDVDMTIDDVLADNHMKDGLLAGNHKTCTRFDDYLI